MFLTNMLRFKEKSFTKGNAYPGIAIRSLIAAKRMRRKAERKKNGLDTVFKNYRPVSNLSFISKVTERAVFLQIDNHMKKHDLYPSLQSAYRKNHGTETALLKVTNDILMKMNSQHAVRADASRGSGFL